MDFNGSREQVRLRYAARRGGGAHRLRLVRALVLLVCLIFAVTAALHFNGIHDAQAHDHPAAAGIGGAGEDCFCDESNHAHDDDCVSLGACALCAPTTPLHLQPAPELVQKRASLTAGLADIDPTPLFRPPQLAVSTLTA